MVYSLQSSILTAPCLILRWHVGTAGPSPPLNRMPPPSILCLYLPPNPLLELQLSLHLCVCVRWRLPSTGSPIPMVVVGGADWLIKACKSEANSACHLNCFLSLPLGWWDWGFPITHPSMLEPSGGRKKRGVNKPNRTNELCDGSATTVSPLTCLNGHIF